MNDATTPARLSVDGGQSGTRIRVRRPSGEVWEFDAPPVFTSRPVLPQVVEHVAALVARERLLPDAVSVGLSGLTDGESDASALLEALRPLGVKRVALAHDSVSGYLGANRLAFGSVAAVGTGVVVLGVLPAGIARVDGWGYLFGDAGSAYWIGRAGIAAALEAFDGRGRPTALEGEVRARFGDPAEVYMVVQADPGRVALVASFARTVAQAAEAGDAVATALLEAAGDELARSVTASLRRVGWRQGDSARVSWVGRVLETNRIIRERFALALADSAAGAALADPYGVPMDGVEQLLDVPGGHPLAAAIRTAG